MSPLHIIEFMLEHGVLSLPFLAVMCWLLWKIDRRSALMTKDVVDLKVNCGKHEDRLDDHEIRITRLDTKVCYLDRGKQQ